MNYVQSVPPAMIERLRNAREFVQEAKDRAARDGREYVDVRFMFSGESTVEIFEALVSKPDMEGAWQAMLRFFDEEKKPAPHSWQFANTCTAIIDAWETSPKRTPREHKEHFQKIADDLMSVVYRIIVEPEFGAMGRVGAKCSPVDQISDEFIQLFIEQIDANPEDRYIKKDQVVSYVRFCLSDIVPDLYRYGAWLAGRAIEISDQPSIGDRPHRSSAKRTFFVRHLSNWFYKTFGARHHEIVAAVTSSLLDEAITGDHVKNLVKGSPEVSPLYRARKLPSENR